MTGITRSSSHNARQATRNFETNFVKYLSIYDGIVRDTIEESDIQLASAIFEDEIRLIPSDNDNSKTVGMEELKRMMQGYLQAGTQFELLEVHILKNCKNQKRGNDLQRDSGASTSSMSSDMSIRIQYSARMIKANGDSEVGTTRILLGASGKIASVIDTPSKEKKDNVDETKDESGQKDNGSIEFQLVGCFGKSKPGTATSTYLRTPVFQSL